MPPGGAPQPGRQPPRPLCPPCVARRTPHRGHGCDRAAAGERARAVGFAAPRRFHPVARSDRGSAVSRRGHRGRVCLMKRFNVLLTAGSRRVALVQAFRAALRSIGVPGSVIVTDVNPLSPSVHVADRSYRVPLATDESYITELLTICEAEQARLLVPTIDDELAGIAAGRDQFKG